MRSFLVFGHVALLASVGLGLLLGGCATVEGVRAKNRESLQRLSLGMPKADVLRVMGTRTVQTYDALASGEKITNPWRLEMYEAAGATWEILYYYTDIKRADGAISDDELTPIVLKDGHLVGWGWSYWNDAISKYEIRIR